MSSRVHTKIMNMTDGEETAGSRVALCMQFHDTNCTCTFEVENLRKLGRMKDKNFLLKQQVDKEKMALNKVRWYQDLLLTGISTLIAFSLSNILGLVFTQIFKKRTSIPRTWFRTSPTI
jgi:hypothetical protein